MSDLVTKLAAQTGISRELVQKGLGAILAFLKKELEEESFDKLQSSVPGARSLTSKFESSPPPSETQGTLFDVVSDLAGKVLGGTAAERVELLSSFSKLGFKPEQIEAFLPRAIELIKSYLSPELVERILAALPALAKLTGSGATQEAS